MNLTIPIKLEVTDLLRDMCRKHPTCEGCCFREEHKGCYFRGKTPREWGNLKGGLDVLERAKKGNKI